MMKDLPLSKVYQLLEPSPVVLLTTAHKGRANVMTMSWHMMVEFEPPLVACVVSNADYSFAGHERVRDRHTGAEAGAQGREGGKLLRSQRGEVREVRSDAGAGRACGAASDRLVFRNLECRVADTRLVNKYNLFVLEVLKAWTDPAQKNPKTIHHHGFGKFVVDGETIKLKSRMR